MSIGRIILHIVMGLITSGMSGRQRAKLFLGCFLPIVAVVALGFYLLFALSSREHDPPQLDFYNEDSIGQQKNRSTADMMETVSKAESLWKKIVRQQADVNSATTAFDKRRKLDDLIESYESLLSLTEMSIRDIQYVRKNGLVTEDDYREAVAAPQSVEQMLRSKIAEAKQQRAELWH